MGTTATPISSAAACPREAQLLASLPKRALSYLLALAGLVWVFHDLQLRQLVSLITVRSWWLVAASVFFDVLTYMLQGLRWRLLLAPVGHLRSLRATQAIYAGLFTNEVVPLRFGELVRAFLASRWLGSGIEVVAPSVIVERFLERLWLAVGLALAAMFVPLPRNLIEANRLVRSGCSRGHVCFHLDCAAIRTSARTGCPGRCSQSGRSSQGVVVPLSFGMRAA